MAAGDVGGHAVLFYGAVGSGKSTVAIEMANAWLCRLPGVEGPCGSCQPCMALSRGKAADLLHIAPKGPSNWIPKAAISPDKGDSDAAAISVQEFFRTPPLAARNKVVWVEDADRLTSEAANAFLKILEEPPDQARLVLTTSKVGSVLATILSRCLAIRCGLPDSLDGGDIEPELLLLAEGAPGRLQAIQDRREWHAEMLGLARQIGQAPRGAALKFSEDFRNLCEKGPGDGSRRQVLAGLEVLAGFLRIVETPGSHLELIVEAHRLIGGNSNASLVLDALFARLLQRQTSSGAV
jgi:hypothetical protein